MAHPVPVSTTATSFGTAATSHPCDLPATVSAGDLLVLIFTSENDGAAPTITGPGGWTQIYNLAESAGGIARGQAVFALTAAGGEGGGTAVIGTSVGTFASAQVRRITGATATLADIASAIGASLVTQTPDPPQVTPSGGSQDYLFIAIAHGVDDDATVNVWPASYTSGVDTGSGGGVNNGATTASATRQLTAASENPGAFTLSEAEGVRAATVAIPPAGGGTPTEQPITSGSLAESGRDVAAGLATALAAGAVDPGGQAIQAGIAALVAAGALTVGGRAVTVGEALEIAQAALALTGAGVSRIESALVAIAARVLQLTGAQLRQAGIVEDLYTLTRAILRAIVRPIS